jgi:hypothetical protein
MLTTRSAPRAAHNPLRASLFKGVPVPCIPCPQRQRTLSELFLPLRSPLLTASYVDCFNDLCTLHVLSYRLYKIVLQTHSPRHQLRALRVSTSADSSQFCFIILYNQNYTQPSCIPNLTLGVLVLLTASASLTPTPDIPARRAPTLRVWQVQRRHSAGNRALLHECAI